MNDFPKRGPGWEIINFDDTGMLAVEITRNYTDTVCYKDDEEAAKAAAKAGVPIIPVSELPVNFKLRRHSWVDTPESRAAIARISNDEQPKEVAKLEELFETIVSSLKKEYSETSIKTKLTRRKSNEYAFTVIMKGESDEVYPAFRELQDRTRRALRKAPTVYTTEFDDDWNYDSKQSRADYILKSPQTILSDITRPYSWPQSGEGWILLPHPHDSKAVILGGKSAYDIRRIAVKNAQDDGVPIIPAKEVPQGTFTGQYIWIDTPENRIRMEKLARRTRVTPEGANIKRILKGIRAGFIAEFPNSGIRTRTGMLEAYESPFYEISIETKSFDDDASKRLFYEATGRMEHALEEHGYTDKIQSIGDINLTEDTKDGEHKTYFSKKYVLRQYDDAPQYLTEHGAGPYHTNKIDTNITKTFIEIDTLIDNIKTAFSKADHIEARANLIKPDDKKHGYELVLISKHNNDKAKLEEIAEHIRQIIRDAEIKVIINDNVCNEDESGCKLKFRTDFYLKNSEE